MKYMVRLDSGAEYGPADIDLLCQWAAQRRIPRSAMLVPDDGSEPVAATSLPLLKAAIEQPTSPPPVDGSHPPTAPTGAVQRPADNGPMSVMIPYRNGAALTAYYLAVFALLPAIGIPLGLVAVVLGIVGLVARRRRPEIHGSVHAWIGIIGGLCIPIIQVIIFITIINA